MTKYRNIDIPDGKDPEDYSYHERRAEILQLIIELGHPDRVSRKQMAERFDVDPAQITRDIQTLREEIHDELSGDAELVTSVIYRRAIREKAEDEEWMEAVELLESWNEWLFETGNQERSADKLEIEGDPGEVYMKLLKQQAGDEEE